MFNELTRLKEAGGELNKRHHHFAEYVERVLAKPTHSDYLKFSLDQYRAAPYKTGQYRIFFEIIDETVQYKTQEDKEKKIPGKFVHFVWMNDETCKHDMSKGEFDPCYRRFKNLKDNQDLEQFIRPLIPRGYVVSGSFGQATALYPTFYDLDGVARAQATVSLCDNQSTSFKLYKLEGLLSEPDSESRELELLINLYQDAQKNGVKLQWEIIRDGNFDRYTEHAQTLGLRKIDSDEVWEVYTN